MNDENTNNEPEFQDPAKPYEINTNTQTEDVTSENSEADETGEDSDDDATDDTPEDDDADVTDEVDSSGDGPSYTKRLEVGDLSQANDATGSHESYSVTKVEESAPAGSHEHYRHED
jgi:hypothetical protein